MKIKNPKTGAYLNIYSARLTFIKEKNGRVSENVRVTIYRYKKRPKRIDLPVPKDIDTFNLNWIKKKGIAVYYRKNGENNYEDYRRVSIHTGLGQKLEDLVKEVCFGNSEQK